MPAIGMAVLYGLSAAIPIVLSADGKQAVVLSIANVIAFVLMRRNPALSGAPGLIGVFIGCLAAQLIVEEAPQALLVSSISVAYLALVLCLTRDRGPSGSNAVLLPKDFGVIILVMCGVSLIAASILGTLSYVFFEMSSFASIADEFFANALGIAILLPFGLSLTQRRLERLADPATVFPLVAWAGLASASSVLALQYTAYPLLLIIVPMLLAATRLKPFEMSITCMSVGVVAVMWQVAHPTEPLHLNGYQAALAITILVPFLACLITRQITSDQKLITESEQRFRRAVHDASFAIKNVDMNGIIIDANDAFARMLGYSLHEVEGHSVDEFTPPDDPPTGRRTIEAMRRGEREISVFQKRYRRKDGTLVWVEITARMLRDPKTGQPKCLVSHIVDIDAAKVAEIKLKDGQAQLEFALASAGQGFWDVTYPSGAYSKNWVTMLGYAIDEFESNVETWHSLIHPDDRARVLADERAHRSGLVEFSENEYRLRHKAGHWVWILDRGKIVERDSTGVPTRLIGTLTDITQRKMVEEELARTARQLAQEKERLRVTLHSIGDAVICVDANDRITLMNPEAERLVGASPQMNMRLADIYDAREDDSFSPLDKEGDRLWTGKVLRRRDGEVLHVREVRSSIGEGENSGHVIVFQDFTRMRRMQSELKRAAQHDELTGLANRSKFLSALETLHASADRNSEHHVLYIDLDRFKAVNDTSGHAAGDALLRLVARTIKGCLRPTDLAARLGGDEFGIILADCPRGLAKLTGNAIVERVGALQFAWGSAVFTIGASIGIATLDPDGSTDDLIARADAACYKAKAAGRGSVWAADPEQAKVVALRKHKAGSKVSDI